MQARVEDRESEAREKSKAERLGSRRLGVSPGSMCVASTDERRAGPATTVGCGSEGRDEVAEEHRGKSGRSTRVSCWTATR